MSRTTHDVAAASGYRLLPHTADVQLMAWGRTREECLAAAVRGLASLFMRPRPGTRTQSEEFAIPAGPDDEQLLGLLDEVMYRIDVTGRVPVAALVSRQPDGGLTGMFQTVAVADIVQTGSVPKATTRHGLHLTCGEAGWRARATIDV